MNDIFNLQQFWHFAQKNDRILLGVAGSCLEGVGVNSDDIIEIDIKHMPRPPRGNEYDVCLCFGATATRDDDNPKPFLQIKLYMGAWGERQYVGSQYAKGANKMNYGFSPLAIFGVASACYDANGHLKWVNDTSDYPTKLGVNTIRSDNVRPLETVKV